MCADHARVFVKTTKRSQIEMIKVRMRKEDQIDVWQLMKCKRGSGQPLWTDRESRQTDSDARKERWIGKDFNAEKIDKHRCVPYPRKRQLRIAPHFGIGFGIGRSDRAPAFNRPLAE